MKKTTLSYRALGRLCSKKGMLGSALVLGMATAAQAQEGAVGIGTSIPRPSAILDIRASQGNKGILIPEVALTDVTVKAPVPDAVHSLLVYNNSDSKLNGLQGRGYYHWDGFANGGTGAWRPLGDANIAAGDDGTSMTSQDAIPLPAQAGLPGDLVLVSTSGDYYEKQPDGTWVKKGNLKGQPGAEHWPGTGEPGEPGTAGNPGKDAQVVIGDDGNTWAWLPGKDGAPGTWQRINGSLWFTGNITTGGNVGTIGDHFLDKDSGEYFEKQVDPADDTKTVWVLKGNLKGAKGVPGAEHWPGTGEPGEPGTDGNPGKDAQVVIGEDGNTWAAIPGKDGAPGTWQRINGSLWFTITGTINPELGTIGDHYLQSETGDYFEMQKDLADATKTVWVKKGNLKGDNGAVGAPGLPTEAPGQAIITPATQVYIDQTTNKLYIRSPNDPDEWTEFKSDVEIPKGELSSRHASIVKINSGVDAILKNASIEMVPAAVPNAVLASVELVSGVPASRIVTWVDVDAFLNLRAADMKEGNLIEFTDGDGKKTVLKDVTVGIKDGDKPGQFLTTDENKKAVWVDPKTDPIVDGTFGQLSSMSKVIQVNDGENALLKDAQIKLIPGNPGEVLMSKIGGGGGVAEWTDLKPVVNQITEDYITNNPTTIVDAVGKEIKSTDGTVKITGEGSKAVLADLDLEVDADKLKDELAKGTIRSTSPLVRVNDGANAAFNDVSIDVVPGLTGNILATRPNGPAGARVATWIDPADMVKANETLTSLDYDAAANKLTYKDEAGTPNELPLKDFVKANETVTILSYDDTKQELFYTNETGEMVMVTLPGNVSYDGTDFYYQYLGGKRKILFEEIVKANETQTALFYDALTNQIRYTPEDGVVEEYTLRDDRLTVLTFNATTKQLEYLDENNEKKEVILPDFVNYNSTTQEFTVINVDGTTSVINIEEIVKANETQTALFYDALTNKIRYTPEDGVVEEYTLRDDRLTVLTFNATTKQLEYLDENNEKKEVILPDFVNYNSTTQEFTVINVDGTTSVINIEEIVKANETQTALFYDALTNKIRYTPEDGVVEEYTLRDDRLTVLTFNATTKQLEYLDENNEKKEVILPDFVNYNSTTQEFTVINVDGTTSVINIEEIVQANGKKLTGDALIKVENGDKAVLTDTKLSLAPGTPGQILTTTIGIGSGVATWMDAKDVIADNAEDLHGDGLIKVTNGEKSVLSDANISLVPGAPGNVLVTETGIGIGGGVPVAKWVNPKATSGPDKPADGTFGNLAGDSDTDPAKNFIVVKGGNNAILKDATVSVVAPKEAGLVPVSKDDGTVEWKTPSDPTDGIGKELKVVGPIKFGQKADGTAYDGANAVLKETSIELGAGPTEGQFLVTTPDGSGGLKADWVDPATVPSGITDPKVFGELKGDDLIKIVTGKNAILKDATVKLDVTGGDAGDVIGVVPDPTDPTDSTKFKPGWIKPSSALDWAVGGNAVADATKNFIGTTDGKPFNINTGDGTNNATRVTVLANGKVGIGTTAPTALLQVSLPEVEYDRAGEANRMVVLKQRTGSTSLNQFYGFGVAENEASLPTAKKYALVSQIGSPTVGDSFLWRKGLGGTTLPGSEPLMELKVVGTNSTDHQSKLFVYGDIETKYGVKVQNGSVEAPAITLKKNKEASSLIASYQLGAGLDGNGDRIFEMKHTDLEGGKNDVTTILDYDPLAKGFTINPFVDEDAGPVNAEHALQVNGSTFIFGELTIVDPTGITVAGKGGKSSLKNASVSNASAMLKDVNSVVYTIAPDKASRSMKPKRAYGLSGAELEKVIPEAVSKDAKGNYGINYNAVTTVMVEAVKEQQTEIDALKKEIEDLKLLIKSITKN